MAAGLGADRRFERLCQGTLAAGGPNAMVYAAISQDGHDLAGVALGH